MTHTTGRDRLVELYRQFWRPVFGYVCRRTDSVEDAADVVSNVFVVACRRIDDVPAGDAAKLWLFGVARRALSEHRRGTQRQDRLAAQILATLREEHAADPAELFARDAEARSVRQALLRLSEADREILTLVVWEGLNPTEAAICLGISAEAARARLARARRRFAASHRSAPHVDGRAAPTPLEGLC